MRRPLSGGRCGQGGHRLLQLLPGSGAAAPLGCLAPPQQDAAAWLHLQRHGRWHPPPPAAGPLPPPGGPAWLPGAEGCSRLGRGCRAAVAPAPPAAAPAPLHRPQLPPRAGCHPSAAASCSCTACCVLRGRRCHREGGGAGCGWRQRRQWLPRPQQQAAGAHRALLQPPLAALAACGARRPPGPWPVAAATRRCARPRGAIAAGRLAQAALDEPGAVAMMQAANQSRRRMPPPPPPMPGCAASVPPPEPLPPFKHATGQATLLLLTVRYGHNCCQASMPHNVVSCRRDAGSTAPYSTSSRHHRWTWPSRSPAPTPRRPGLVIGIQGSAGKHTERVWSRRVCVLQKAWGVAASRPATRFSSC